MLQEGEEVSSLRVSRHLRRARRASLCPISQKIFFRGQIIASKYTEKRPSFKSGTPFWSGMHGERECGKRFDSVRNKNYLFNGFSNPVACLLSLQNA
jgi:hypothetical protein